MSTELVPYSQIERMAAAVAKSGLFGMKTQEQALSLMVLAQAEGVHPMIAARDFHIIEGRPALKADALLARFHQAGGKVEWHTLTNDKAEATFSHPQGGAVTLDWTIQRAQAAGLANRNTWKSYPRAMLRARVISEGVRTIFPGVAVGTYTVEEVQDMAPHEIDVTPREQLLASKPSEPLNEAEIDEHMVAMRNASNIKELRRAYETAYTVAEQRGDSEAMMKFEARKNERKEELEEVANV